MKYNLKNKFPEPPRMSLWDFTALKFKEFCARTDLHGFKYITMEGLSVAERSVWALAVVISIICAGFLLVTAYKWYAKNPVVTVVETTQGVIWDIPFPAVTLCDLNIVSKSAARRLSRELTLPSNVTADFVFKTLRLAPLLHSLKTVGAREKRDLHTLQDVLELNKMSMKTLFQRLSPSTVCSNIMDRCMWKNTMYHCNQIFRHIFVTVHLCCTFNYYAVNDVDNELKVFRFAAPRRVASCGYQTALTVIVKTDPTDYYSSNHASYGSLVFVDNAYNVPDLDSPMRVVSPAAELLVAVSAERTYATSGIRSFPVRDRHCYYTDEIEIDDINQYSFHNCRALRRVQLLVKLCDCVPFYFPKKDRNRICTFNDIACMENLSNMTYIQGLVFNDTENVEGNNLWNVECLPECEHFSYPMQVGMGTISNRVPLTGIEFYKGTDLRNRSVVNVFFNDLVATRYRRDAYLNWQNILAAFGGLLSLMLGFTVISLVDFFLFFVLRVGNDALDRYFNGEDFSQSVVANQAYFISVAEQKKREKSAKITPSTLKKYQELKKKQANVLTSHGKIKY